MLHTSTHVDEGTEEHSLPDLYGQTKMNGNRFTFTTTKDYSPSPPPKIIQQHESYLSLSSYK